MLLDECGKIVTSTYWGSRRGIEFGGSYQGDHLLRYDPATREVSSLGVPVPGFGIPSLAMSPDRKWIFGEAVDPASEPDAGAFFVADAKTGEVVFLDDSGDHVGFRDMLVTAEGEVMYSRGAGDLAVYDPSTGVARTIDGELPGEWLRGASPIADDGSVFGVTRDPDQLFRFDSPGDVSDLGPLEGYVASLALSPDGSTLYYVPEAHGSAWEIGTPLIAVDTATGERRTVVRLNDLIEPALGLRVGGTYNVVVAPDGETVYVGLNAAPPDAKNTFGQVVLAVVDIE